MDLIFSCTPLSTTLSPTTTKPFRSDFLGCCHYLRPPGASAPPPPRHSPLHHRGSKCKRFLRLRENRSQILLVNASLDSNSVIVVVAVTTLCALSFASVNHHLNNKNGKTKKTNEVSSSPSVLLPQLGKSIVSHIVSLLDVGDVNRVTTDAQRDDLVKKVREECHRIEAEETNIEAEEIGLFHCSNFPVTTKEAVGGILSSNASISVALEEFEAATGSVAPPSVVAGPAILKLGVVEPVILATEMSESHLEETRDLKLESEHPDERREEIELDSDLPKVTAKIRKGVASVPQNHKFAEKNGKTAYCYSIPQEPIRGDLYMFYEENQRVVKFPSSVNSFKALSSNSYHHKLNITSPMEPKTISLETGLSIQNCGQTAENAKRKSAFAGHGRVDSRKHKNLGRSRGFPREKERGYMVQDNWMELPKLASLDGDRANDFDHLEKQMNKYNHLLRDGRLSECVDLLEDLERRNLLDMNKVHHAKFFNNCKNQRAVKIAFRFCKLITNPTLSTFNMLMSVCTSSQDSEGAFQVLRLAQEAGLKADCKLYTTLISTCAKSGKVDKMFEVFHEMVNAGIEPNVHTYGALIDGCARAGQVAKAFGAYGIMRSKSVKPDRVVFNALITACGQSGAVDRAFDVLAEMKTEAQPIDPDHITVGALIKACAKAGQVDRGQEAYRLVHEYNIKGTPELYTIAVNCCSQTGDWDFACSVYDDMTRKGVVPDEVFLSAMIDAAGHSGKVDAAFAMLKEAKQQGMQLGIIPYSSLMGACCNAKNWEKALELYEDIKSTNQKPTVSTMNALITALCEGDQLEKAVQVLEEMKSLGLCPNTITYSVLLVASERSDDIEIALTLFSQAKEAGLGPTLIMCKCIIAMCLQRFQKACMVGEPVLSFDSGRPQIENKWTTLALTVYRETIAAGEKPTAEAISQVLGCLRFPRDASLKDKLVEYLGFTPDIVKRSRLCSLLDGFGEYDPRAFSLLEEAASHGIVPCVSFKESPIVVDAKLLLHIHIAEVYLLTILKGLKHRLAAGAKLPNVTILLPIDKTEVTTSEGGKAINLSGRLSRAVGALLRRLRLPYQGNESYGKIRINGIALRRWFQPKLDSPFSGKPGELNLSPSHIRKGIFHQQRNIRTGNLSLE